MKTKKEIHIAIGVALLMILICVVICLVQINSNKANELNIKVYKLYEVEDSETEHVYKECRISTEDQITLKKEFKRATSISESKAVVGRSINGSYKIVIDDNYIAFDNEEDKIVFDGEKNKLFNLSSSMYEIVINSCN